MVIAEETITSEAAVDLVGVGFLVKNELTVFNVTMLDDTHDSILLSYG